MKKISLALALAFSGIALANQTGTSDSLKGIKPFVGVLIGTFKSNGASASYLQTGLWGGAEINFMDNLGVRAYANIITTPLGASITSGSKTSSTFMIFSGNVDVIYRPIQKLGIFIGLGLGDVFYSTTWTTGSLASQSIIGNVFTLFGNYGVQYNIDSHNLLELSAILNIHYNSLTTIGVSYNIMAKYAYRF